ncbi:hsp90 co-chaperone Cdc37 isoform X3 [Micropterus dolomieu]|uniref:hsp90 co-chaperone Cdc37 isoform X3 n=1 Tax=Micropterus dolomieu TaxID=147949 RepID=UPI001E8E9E51|nr:hsp90 co-chaperone Cdc37 isoform X3 [Micropterus dolomieu]
MSTGAGIDYSVWDHIYVSDDEDVTSPYVDTSSLFRMRHRARLERMAEFQHSGEDLENNFAECKRLLEKAQGRLKELEEEGRNEEEEAELKKVQAESVLNIKAVTKEKEKIEKHKTFVETYGKEIKHFGLLRRWDDSQKYLSDNPHLVCDETANCLVAVCIDFEIDEKHALMEQVAHQAIVMQFILDLARTLKVDPRGCFRQFFSKIKIADKTYQDAFDRELELLKGRVRSCAQIRMDSAMKELEEEERQKRLGPGGLDPVEVYESLPKRSQYRVQQNGLHQSVSSSLCKEIQKSFDEKNIQMLQIAINKLDPEEGKYHLRRCIDSGLWVPDSGEGDDDDKEEDEEEEED